MSSVAFIRRMLAAGFTLDDALSAAEAFEATVHDAPKPRSAAAERQARYRAKRNGDVTRYVTGDVTPTVTRDVTSVTVTSLVTPPSCARDKDINLTSVDRPNLTTLQASECANADGLDWPETDKPSKSYLDQLATALRQAAGAAINPTSPGILVLAPILALGRTGSGPPCDLNADVLPIIAARAQKARPNSITQWGYFTEAIREARDRRLAGAPASQKVFANGRSTAQDRFDRRQLAHAADFAGADLAAELRAQRG